MIRMKKLLIVDDEVDIAASIQYLLTQEGFATILAHDGNKAMQMYENEKPDLIILDLMMPGIDGYEVCRRIRANDKRTPILMLTARTSEIDTVVGLELGANDYIAKPVRLRELVARVKAHLRESPQVQDHGKGIRLGDLAIDTESRTVTVGDRLIDLTFKEFELLLAMARQPNRVFSRDQLFAQVWGSDFLGESRTVDVHIRYLREKLEANPSQPKHILTVRGVGYRLVWD
ncbi:MAG: response regulator transcription factor [Candidatus Obscuribacterales bacterium]|jgi:DNA-binding response OmpR family regulator|nr:response regulator transcription factor [Candidatus Obscuribacterales bacterium]